MDDATPTPTENPLLAKLGPAPYSFAGYWQAPSKELLTSRPELFYQAMREAPATGGRPSSCSICGTYIVHHFLIRCGDGSVWFAGSDCIEKIDPEMYAAIKRARREEIRAARAEQHRERRKAEERAARVARSARARAFLVEHPEVAGLLRALRAVSDGPNLCRALIEWGSLTDGQIRYARNRVEDLSIVWGRIPSELPKRVAIEGKVLAVKLHESAFGETWKMIVRAELPGSGGAVKLWGSVPRVALDPRRAGPDGPAARRPGAVHGGRAAGPRAGVRVLQAADEGGDRRAGGVAGGIETPGTEGSRATRSRTAIGSSC